MTKTTSYEWILFDLDNTLMDFTSASHHAFHDGMKALGLPEHHIDYGVYNKHNHDVWSLFEAGEITTEVLRPMRYQRYFDAMGHKRADATEANAEYVRQLAKHPIMVPGAMDLLDSLKPVYKLAIVTNGLKEAQRPRLRAANIYDHFDVIVVSDEIGSAKPQKEYFDHVIKEIRQPDLSKSIVIGDSLNSDIKGAVNYGIDCCWYNPHRKEGNDKITPTSIAHSISDIHTLLIG